MNSILVEKYRPAELANYIGDSVLLATIGQMIQKQDIPHLLFSGSPGTGKTTIAKIIVSSIACDYIYINASDENNIETVRTKIKSFASTFGFSPLKVIILDEADFLTMAAQAALRNVMETFSEHVRFILTCNYPEKIIPAIVSRTQHIHIIPPAKTRVASLLADILETEKISYNPNDIVYLINTYYPDIRKIIGTAQLSELNGVLTINTDKKAITDSKLKIIEILASKSKLKFKDIRQLIADSKMRDFTDLYTLLYEKVDLYAPNHISEVILHIAEGQRHDIHVVNKEINIMSVMINIIQTIG